MTRAQKAAWAVLVTVLACAGVFFAATAHLLPQRVAVHFDADGSATSFMTKARYRWLMGLAGVLLPLALVLLMNVAYSTARTLRLPHHEYWMAPPRIAGTRAFLKAHAVWFGTMLIVLMSFMHHLILVANLSEPPQLPEQVLLVGAVALLFCTALWIGTLMFKFRRPV